MSCNGPYYNPAPTREWSRADARCAFDASDVSDTTDTGISPLTGKVIPIQAIAEHVQMINKGNVLQYKKNAGLTQAQTYALKMRGNWRRSGRTHATQSSTYTNPNTGGLAQEGGTFRASAQNPTHACVLDKPPFVVQVGGHLVSGTVKNPCTGQITNHNTSCSRLCFPTTASGVPGPVKPLCWNAQIAPWFSKKPTNLATGGGKWPTNAPLKSADGRYPPML
jgi:hypothetical protein